MAILTSSMDASNSVDSSSTATMKLYDVSALMIDDDGNWIRPEYPRYQTELAPAKPFLVPSFDDEVVEILPSTKQNRKINFDESVYVMEIENRFQMMLAEDQVEEDDEVSYEIEIVEGGQTDDADFYLEMIDGEIFYVFETEDDISVDEEEGSGGEDSDESSSEQSDDQSSNKVPMQLDIGGMMAPNLNESFAANENDNKNDPMYITDDDDDDDDDSSSSSSNQQQMIIPAQLQIDQMIVDAQAENKQKHPSDHTTEATSIASTSPSITVSFVPHPHQESLEESLNDFTALDDLGKVPPIAGTVNAEPLSPTQKPVATKGDEADQFSPNQSMRSILKVSYPSPKIESPKRNRKEKKQSKDGKKQKKTFTKTYVRADDFDGEHRVYSWEKPAWAEHNPLRSTGKGDAILKGANLAQPITDTRKILKSGKVKWEKPDWASAENDENNNSIKDLNNVSSSEDSNNTSNAKEELIRKIQEGGLNLPSRRKSGNRLKITLNGSCLREGSDIVKPITKATVIKRPANINPIANPKILRATPIGSKAREGKSLEGPTTLATQIKKYKFEQPSWTHGKLRSTAAGDILKKGGDVALAITPSTADQNRKQKDDWKAKRGIGRQASASIAEEIKRREYTWAKPSWAIETKLRKTPKGDVVRAGRGLARPITILPHLKGLQENEAETNTEETTTTSAAQKFMQREENGLGCDEGADDEYNYTLESFSEHPNSRIGQRAVSECFDHVSLLSRRRSLEDPVVSRSKSLD